MAEIIFKTTVGSSAQGLFISGVSDVDYRYITKPTLMEIISPFKKDEIKSSSNDGEDTESYLIIHFCRLLTSGNPTVYEVIRSDLYDRDLPYAELIRGLFKYCFDGKKILDAHIGYCDAQIRRYLAKANQEFSELKYGDDGDVNKPHSEYLITDIWEENKCRRVGKSVVAGYRVLAQANQLLTTGDFCPIVKDYSPELHDKLMAIKTMDATTITWEFIQEHLTGLEQGIQDLKALYANLPEEIKYKKPDIDKIEGALAEIYGI